MNTTPEQWRPIVGYEGAYEVSSHGNVWACERTVYAGRGRTRNQAGKMKHPSTQSSGHLFVGLYSDNQLRIRRVHQLVAEAFIGPRPDGLEVCHNNGDPTDNRPENLRYGTKSDNGLDAVLHGSNRNANKTHCIRGHEFTAGNTGSNGQGGRRCKACSYWRGKAKRQRLASLR